MIPGTDYEAENPYEADGMTDADDSAVDRDETAVLEAEYAAPYEASDSPTAEIVMRDFEDLTLAEMVGQFWRAPRATYTALVTIASRPARPHFPKQRYRRQYSGGGTTTNISPTVDGASAASPTDFGGVSQTSPGAIMAETPVYAVPMRVTRPAPDRLAQPARQSRAEFRLLLQGLSIFFAIFGNALYLQINSFKLLNDISPTAGLPFFAVAALLWLAAEMIGRADEVGAEVAIRAHQPADEFFILNLPQIMILVVALALGVAAYFLNSENKFTLTGVFAWFASIALICMYGLSSAGVNLSPLRAWRRMRAAIGDFNADNRWMIAALIVITIAGAGFRLFHLDVMLPEMTSDHVEKLLDSQRVADGDYNIFFSNNGGREPFQMYALAALATLPGIDINFMGLKLLAVIESVFTIPIFWWMGRAVIGDRDDDTRRLGNWVGLAAALLLAGGYWHAAITRVALRIILTPLVVSLLLIFLSRAMRYNRRADFVLAGLVLGFGVYTYQAVRILPIVVVIGIGLALFFHLRGRHQRIQMIFNLAILVIVSFIVFLPLFRFSVERPQDFWRRTEGRLFGDDIITETLPDGTLIERTASLTERVEAFSENLPKLAGNVVRAVGMFNYRGDLAWFHNAPMYPAMDTVTGALLVVGAVGWLVLIFRKRDVVYILIPIALLVMLMPSALSIAIIEENPSHTRASGAMPSAYLLAAFGLASLCYTLRRTTPRMIGAIFATGTLIAVGAVVFWGSGDRLFNAYRPLYIDSWHQPLSEAGEFLEGFARSDGGYGNAFMVAFPHWWDYRAVAIEAGLPPGSWPNGDIGLIDLPTQIADAARRDADSPFRLNVDRDLLFLYSPDDGASEEQFQAWFPDGQTKLLPTYIEGINFKVYRVPALGEEGFNKFLAANDIAF